MYLKIDGHTNDLDDGSHIPEGKIIWCMYAIRNRSTHKWEGACNQPGDSKCDGYIRY